MAQEKSEKRVGPDADVSSNDFYGVIIPAEYRLAALFRIHNPT